ncbi:hypothetical protein FRB99_004990 [Tulasnella sp. 403]|nr:hypothetical protein FRB99_004990 [Tulasnella sp. 403]
MRTSAAILLLVASLVSHTSAVPLPSHTVALAQLYGDQSLARRTPGRFTDGVKKFFGVGPSTPPNAAPKVNLPAPAAADPAANAFVRLLDQPGINAGSLVKKGNVKITEQVKNLAKNGHLGATPEEGIKVVQNQDKTWKWIANGLNVEERRGVFGPNGIKSMMEDAMKGGFNPTDDLLKALQLSRDDLLKAIPKIV